MTRSVGSSPGWERFPELPATEVEQAVYGRYGTFDESPVRDFVRVLVERATREQLADQRYRRHRAQSS